MTPENSTNFISEITRIIVSLGEKKINENAQIFVFTSNEKVNHSISKLTLNGKTDINVKSRYNCVLRMFFASTTILKFQLFVWQQEKLNFRIKIELKGLVIFFNLKPHLLKKKGFLEIFHQTIRNSGLCVRGFCLRFVFSSRKSSRTPTESACWHRKNSDKHWRRVSAFASI